MRIGIFIMTLFLFLTGVKAQDIHFSQVINNPLHINPANTGGFQGYERAILNYRNQWSSVSSPYNTMGFSADLPMFQGKGNKAHLGLGLNFYSDKAGDSNFGVSQGNLSIAGIVPLQKEHFLSAGVQIGYAQRSVSLSGLNWANQYNGEEFDPTLPSYEVNSISSFGYLDLAAGMRYEYRSQSTSFQGWDVRELTFGAAVFHVNDPQLRYFSGGSEELYKKWVGHFRGHFDVPGTDVSFIPFGAFFLQGEQQEINIGALARFELTPGTMITGLLSESALYGGLQYRVNDAVIPYVMYEFTHFGIGLSFDINVSTLKTVSRGFGGFEISLRYQNLRGALFQRRTGSSIYN